MSKIATPRAARNYKPAPYGVQLYLADRKATFDRTRHLPIVLELTVDIIVAMWLHPGSRNVGFPLVLCPSRVDEARTTWTA